MGSQQYRAAFESLGNDVIRVEDELAEIGKWPEDFDGTRLNLRECIYTMPGALPAITRMLRKGSPGNEIVASTYLLLKNFKHPVALPVENFIQRGQGPEGSLVVPHVKGSLKGWIRKTEGSQLFEVNGNERAISPLFRGMIIDICGLMFKLFKQKMYPGKFGLEDLYLDILDDTPRVLLLLTDVRKAARQIRCADQISIEQRANTWGYVQATITQCCEICHVKLDDLSTSFYNFIGSSLMLEVHDVDMLKYYPDNWDLEEKASYIMLAMSGLRAKHITRSQVNNTSITWPRDGDGLLMPIIKQLIDSKKVVYESYAYDYILLCKNSYKHFNDLPDNLKNDLGGDSMSLIRMMEEYDPRIWINLYEQIGPLNNIV